MSLPHVPVLCAALALAGLAEQARAQERHRWQFGAVLDVTATSRALELGGRDRGLQLGHSDLTARGPLGESLRAQVTASLATHEGKLEKGIEELWLESTSLPAGLQVRAGRFASQIGYLNPQHPHADDFIERPLLYRAFFGGHWSDDGVRANWTAPLPFYLMVGLEAFRGKRLVAEVADPVRNPGVATWVLETGADIGKSHSWQLGVSHIRNRREAIVEDHDHGAQEEEHDHGARFSGRRTWMIDATWKWAPGGNSRGQQLRSGVEWARVSGLNRFAARSDRHVATALTLAWRFDEAWEVGVRTDRLRVRMPHEDHFHSARMSEHAVMVAWKPTHMHSLRLQASTQRDVSGFDAPARRSVQLQVVMAFGAHGAHAF